MAALRSNLLAGPSRIPDTHTINSYQQHANGMLHMPPAWILHSRGPSSTTTGRHEQERPVSTEATPVVQTVMVLKELLAQRRLN